MTTATTRGDRSAAAAAAQGMAGAAAPEAAKLLRARPMGNCRYNPAGTAYRVVPVPSRCRSTAWTPADSPSPRRVCVRAGPRGATVLFSPLLSIKQGNRRRLHCRCRRRRRHIYIYIIHNTTTTAVVVYNDIYKVFSSYSVYHTLPAYPECCHVYVVVSPSSLLLKLKLCYHFLRPPDPPSLSLYPLPSPTYPTAHTHTGPLSSQVFPYICTRICVHRPSPTARLPSLPRSIHRSRSLYVTRAHAHPPYPFLVGTKIVFLFYFFILYLVYFYYYLFFFLFPPTTSLSSPPVPVRTFPLIIYMLFFYCNKKSAFYSCGMCVSFSVCTVVGCIYVRTFEEIRKLSR